MRNYIVDSVFIKVTVSDFWISLNKTAEQKRDSLFRKAKSLKESIERHCDDFESVDIDNEGHYECSFCHYYNASKDDYECCDESVKEHRAKTKQEKQDDIQS